MNISPNENMYSREEYDSALDFAMYLYGIWCQRNKNAIIKVDKITNNEEPTDVDKFFVGDMGDSKRGSSENLVQNRVPRIARKE